MLKMNKNTKEQNFLLVRNHC